jgi:hypothetical protein
MSAFPRQRKRNNVINHGLHDTCVQLFKSKYTKHLIKTDN